MMTIAKSKRSQAIFASVALAVWATSLCFAQKAPEGRITIDPSLPWSERMALSEILRLQQNRSTVLTQTGKRWGYVSGLLLPAMQDVWKRTGKEIYYAPSESYAKLMVRADGTYDQRRDGTFEYYAGERIRFDDGKATGPFIRAALEIETMNEWQPQVLAARINLFELQQPTNP